MDPKVQSFLKQTGSAAMVTLKKDGTPHAVRVGVALVDGKLWAPAPGDQLNKSYGMF